MRTKDKKNLFKVGAFLTGLTVILMIFVVSIGQKSSIFASKVDIKAHVPSVQNLRPGSYVELKGIRIGSVTDIRILSEDNVEIVMNILNDQLRWIKQDSKVSISNAGLVGDKYIEIFNGTKSSPVFDPSKDILFSESTTDIKKIITKGESIATVTERILNRLDVIFYNMEEGKQIIQTMHSLNKASRNLEVITTELREAHLGGMVKNVNSTMARLDKASGSLERILGRVENGPGTMNSMIYDDGLHDDLRALLGGAQRNKVIKYFIRESIKNSERKKPQAD